ncbi:head-tail connector protein [Sphingomonas hengshuiensis]|uniref:Phage gp6-like head-tail connector protein n=1 Tax=Sphingomonas hengshuiensis TaxID=1609977 RepID=A0A7U4J9W3_9SPHN|nr:head-tail connector protein [Sphingomonas hengshuiensis]AJP72932.1 hypothetical protein TS85_15730 [Sphingomonas hengshuiensis]
MAILTLEDAKQHLKVDTDDRDDEIVRLIAAAERAIERTTRLVPTRRAVSFAFASFAPELVLSLAPIAAETVAIRFLDAVGDEQTVSPADFRVVPFEGVTRLVPAIGKSWPQVASAQGAVRVDAEAGFDFPDTMPAALVHAARLMIGAWFDGASESALKVAADLLELERLIIA